MQAPRSETGSFRDREARVFYRDGGVYRALSQQALNNWNQVNDTRFFGDAMSAGRVVRTSLTEIPADEIESSGIPWAAVLQHDRIPYVSYPYEWSFGMLKDGALLQLELLEAALNEGFTLKDSSAYNIQWVGSTPVFIDVPSFQPLLPGEPWVGYLQFCQLFLYPLLLTSYKNAPFQPWLRGSIDGIQPKDFVHLFSLRDRLRPGVFTNVYMQARLQALMGNSTTSLKKDLEAFGPQRELILANVRRLRKLVTGLRWKAKDSQWASYAENHSYDEVDHDAKRQFVATVASERHWSLVWDLGCNTGTFSMIAAEKADYVVAIDSDHLAIDRLYGELKRRDERKILPLVGNLTDPSPDLGWRGRERLSLPKRGTPDLVIALALIHHIVIGSNVPLDELVEWLASLGSHLLIEFVTKEDPMVQKLLLNKDDNYADYESAYFERSLGRHFELLRKEVLQSKTRHLYFLGPKTS